MATPRDVIDAWADIRDWVQNTLPELAQQQILPDESQDAGDIGACEALNQGGSHSAARWGSNGDATVALSALRIAVLSGVTIQPAITGESNTVHLPLSFSQLEVTGVYSYGQPCALYDAGKKTDTTTTNGNGTIVQSISDNSMYYVADLGATVTLGGVVVNGDPSVTVNPNTDGLPSWLVSIASFFSTFNEAQVLRSTLQNVFLTADFSKTMVALLNKQIGG
jgi:hypothetical protein